MQEPPEDDIGEDKATVPGWRRWLPIGLLLAALALAIIFRVDRLLDFDALSLRYAGLERFVADEPMLAIALGLGLYALVTALSIPGAWILSVLMGLVFGWLTASIVVVIGATLGASALFFAARSALAAHFRARAGGWVKRFADGLKGDAASYLLFLRLTPVVPFTLLNILPGIVGIPYRVFVWTTAVGIAPATIAYAFAGEGLRSIITERAEACAQGVAPCGTGLDASRLVTPQILIAFSILAVVSLLPVLLKRLRAHRLLKASRSRDQIG
ncbi:TVP38/TMEM64 family protein [Arsenicitalea aurantiaca]|uniref:TVP38/TMEM64 family membrane protein n=1 Tax=Arsenicitalea aurantiaca TaxID=1783274 RepID=A0A433X2G6_9HYPH|nr:VTT domain-containing protein [Arsenicitalea aurantiaca]RUT28227.1 TVP38/TMEM64 family protein [Arsenicitalea aurantiaca]